MKKIVLILITLLSTITVSAQRTGSMDIAGVTCNYDTTVHRRIGPGVTYTQYQFNSFTYNGRTYKMRAHVFKVDMHDTNHLLTAYRAKDSYYKVNTQVQQYKLEEQKGTKPFASTAGLGWFQSNTSDITSQPYELGSHMVSQRVIYYTAVGKISSYYIDADNTAHLGNVQLAATAKTTDKTFTVGQVNHCRDIADKKGSVSLFCNNMTSWAVDNSTGTDVQLKVLSSDGKIVKGENSCEVVSVYSGCHHTNGDGYCILSASGSQEDQLQQLTPGEKININIDYLDDNNNNIDLKELIYICYPANVDNGVVKCWNRINTAFPCIGISEDGKTTYLADIEISKYSNAPSDCLSYLMKNIGAKNSCWMDGGPSAEMTVDGEWITINSIGYGFNGRYIPGGIMLFSTAPDDSNITDIELSDPTPRNIYNGDTISLTTYAYNQYGEMILKNAEKTDKLEMTCSNGIGTFVNGEFIATKTGEGIISIKVPGTGVVKTIPVSVTEHRILSAYPQSLFTGEGRECQLTLTLTDSEGSHSVNPADAVWSTNSNYVVKSCTNGRIVPMIDGSADVFVSYDGLSDTINVTVENLETEVAQLDLTDQMYEPNEPELQLPSVPYAFSATITGEPETIVSLHYTLGNDEEYTETDSLSSDGTATLNVKLNYDGVDTYPVTVTNITATSKNVTPSITNLTAYYSSTSGIRNITSSSTNDSDAIYSITGQRVSHARQGIFIRNNKKIIKTNK